MIFSLLIFFDILAIITGRSIKNHNAGLINHEQLSPKQYRKLQEDAVSSQPSWYDSSLPFAYSSHELHHHPTFKNSRRLRSEIVPLFPGYGTHFAYVYVGTPPQRQSVIIDTGSHYTAFPCSGCNQCGTHTDPYFEIKNSSSANVMKCLNTMCLISQSYTEGSSWHGYKVSDKLWVGGAGVGLLPGADKYNIDFVFGCQTSETGLFRTQLADGIMGMSDSEDTLPNQLIKNKVTDSKVFALCYRIGGGIMTLGGVDQRLHGKKPITYVKMEIKQGGWYGVNIKDIKFVRANAQLEISLQEPSSKYNTGKGVIVDSGTTDTYLPSSILSKFSQEFVKASGGIAFSSGNVALSAAQLLQLPDLTFVLEGLDGEDVLITMPMSSYVDNVGDGKYAFRIYLTEKAGATLGANFMNSLNVIFDTQNKRMGFVKSTCNYQEWAPVVTEAPTLAPTKFPGEIVEEECDPKVFTALTECNAVCNREEAAYVSKGTQDFINSCADSPVVQTRPCTENCTYSKIVRGDPHCPDHAWSECSHSCMMSRSVVPYGEPLLKHDGKCNYHQQTATCYFSLCPRHDGDYLIYIDMRVNISPAKWTYVYSESFYNAFNKLFKLKGASIELLNNAGSETTFETKLHFQIRLKAKDYTGTTSLHDAAEKIVLMVRNQGFPQRLIKTLDEVSFYPLDHETISRFGWLNHKDILVLSAISLPIGDVHDKDIEEKDNKPPFSQSTVFIVGVVLGLILVVIIMGYSYYRLRYEYDMLSKDKSTLAKSSEALRKLWTKFASITSNNKGKASAPTPVSLQREHEFEMSRSSLIHAQNEDDLDSEEGFQ